MAKYIILGSNAFSGQDFVDLLLDDPSAEVLGISRGVPKPDLFLRYRQRRDLSRFAFHRLDLNSDSDTLLSFLDAQRPEYLINFAAQSEVGPSWEFPEQWFETNCVALAKLVNHLRKQGYLKRYLHVSSPEAYGSCVGVVTEAAPLNPSTPYAASKAGADYLLGCYAKTYGFPLVTVRATNVYGARQQLFKIMMRSVINIRKGRVIQLHGGGTAVKSYIHIRDVSRGELAILSKGRQGEIYHLSPDSGVAVRDVVRIIAESLGKRFEDVTETVAERPGQDAAYVIDSTKARTELGWAPQIGLREGIGEVIDWIDANWETVRDLPANYVHRP